MNHLKNETSPYLNQHADNPVDWYPWCEEAIRKAGREDKPIFLSVGYSACHWCHVMAHESFEEQDTADFLNAHFVSIKVDREERPDLDALYMRAVTLMTGSGGWPLTVFLTPSLKPFYGGTYFPPEARHGMPSFPQVLAAVLRAYGDQRGQIEGSAEEVAAAVSRSFEPPPSDGMPGPEVAEASARAILRRFDEGEGGFGAGPKFPQPPLLDFLLDEALREPGRGLREKVFLTLRKMEAGGVRDQVGGGFHRYSVDGAWRVPHFEKMLYDNAQLASLYFRASSFPGGEAFARVGEEVLGDILRIFPASGGGFVAALDADSDGEEGKFYLWSPGKVRAVLGEKAQAVLDLYGIREGGGLEGGVLHRTRAWSEAAGVADPETFAREIGASLDALRSARARRVPPAADTKVLTDWNALTAEAFLDGHRATGRRDFLLAGLDVLRTSWARCWDGRTLHHVWDGERAKVGGFLADYACLARAEWRAYEETGNPPHLERTGLLVGAALRRFRGEGGRLYDSPADGSAGDLLLPVRDADDGVLPSPLAVLAGVLWRWERLTGDGSVREALDQILRDEAGGLRELPGARPLLAGLVAARAVPAVEVVVSADAPCAEADALLAAARRSAPPHALILPLYGAAPDGVEHRLFERRRREAGVSAYVCVGGACRLPASSAGELQGLLRDAVRAAQPGGRAAGGRPSEGC